MATIQALYLQDPFWIWLALGGLLVSLSLATGAQALMWPAMAAVVVALFEIAGLNTGFAFQAFIFVVLCLAVFALQHRLALVRPAVATAGGDPPERQARGVAGRQEQTARLIGRIGRTTSEFVNGVGRVWIDGAEWGAELETGEDLLPEGAPVRVVKVTGGVRLKVHPLITS
jgi:membrane protein implicated in regulation of membrane protease activity